MKKTGVIIQARVGSTRLPGKVLLKILDKTILEFVIERVQKATLVDSITVATTDKKDDQAIMDLSKSLGVNAFAGSEEDVLDRFYEAAKLYNIEYIVRITADCPMIDPILIDKVIDHCSKTGADYSSNTLKRTFPDGQDIEVFNFNALEDAWKEAKLLSEREHVTPYIIKHNDKFKLANLQNKVDLSEKRWSLDEKADFDFLKVVLESIYPSNPDFNMNDVLEFLRVNPDVESINKHISINEGYQKSLRKDRSVR